MGSGLDLVEQAELLHHATTWRAHRSDPARRVRIMVAAISAKVRRLRESRCCWKASCPRFGIEHVDRRRSPCRLPTSKSLKSCAGVIFTAPVPFSGSAYSSATIGMRRPTSGRTACLPIRCCSRSFVRMHGDAGVAQHRLGPRRRDHDEGAGRRPRSDSRNTRDARWDSCREPWPAPLHRRASRRRVHLNAPVHLDLLHFEVGDRGLQRRVPIDEALVLIDQPVAVELDEHLDDSARQTLVHA